MKFVHRPPGIRHSETADHLKSKSLISKSTPRFKHENDLSKSATNDNLTKHSWTKHAALSYIC